METTKQRLARYRSKNPSDWRAAYRDDYARPFRKRGTNQPFTRSRDRLQWMEPVDLDGLRHEGLSHEILSHLRHTGWFTSEGGWTGETTAGTVYRLPAKHGRARFIYGRTDECNQGAALIALDVVDGDDAEGYDARRDAAAWGDSMAESDAEEAREHDRAYQAGQRAAQADADAKTTAAELRGLLAELKQERREGKAERPTICAALRSHVRSLWNDLHQYRADRDRLKDDAPTYDADLMATWNDGFSTISPQGKGA